MCLLEKRVAKTIKNEVKKQKGGLISWLIATLISNSLENMLGDKGFIRVGKGAISSSGILVYIYIYIYILHLYTYVCKS